MRSNHLKRAVALSLAAAIFGSAAVAGGAKKPFTVAGTFVEGCSCNAPCACEITGLVHGCQGAGAFELTSGKYGGVDLAGGKFAFAAMPGSWVRVYVQPKSPAQAGALKDFGRAYSSIFGKIESVRDASISISGSNGKYHLTVDGGKTIDLTTEPILGADGKSAVVVDNVKDPMRHTFMLARTVSGKFKDGNRSFELKGSNGFFNNKWSGNGTL